MMLYICCTVTCALCYFFLYVFTTTIDPFSHTTTIIGTYEQTRHRNTHDNRELCRTVQQGTR